MNPSTQSAGQLTAAPRYNLSISIQEIDNGFVLNSYDSMSNSVYCASLDEVRSKLQGIFAK
jgi:hypothetical protein